MISKRRLRRQLGKQRGAAFDSIRRGLLQAIAFADAEYGPESLAVLEGLDPVVRRDDRHITPDMPEWTEWSGDR
jgi:hypothetical protein